MADEAATTPRSVADPGTATPTLAPGTATGTATPQSAISIPLTAEQRTLSLKVSLADLTARASGLYAQKKFDEAAEVYAQAAEMQAEMNGEMSPENAEILFLYGRSLFKVGQGKSDVLGGKAPATDGGKPKQQQKKAPKKANGAPKAEPAPEPALVSASQEKVETPEADRVAQEAVKIIADDTSAGQAEQKEVEAKKPLFQFTGDENWVDSDEEDDAAAEGERDEDEEEDDDLATAFEILDLARVLLLKRLEEKLAGETTEGKGKEKAENGNDDNNDSQDVGLRHINERLADTHDILAEISLENERYPNAIADARESLKYKQQLYGEDSEIIAEAHFKLSLALEFASVTAQADDEGAGGAAGGANAPPREVNQELRDEAAKELEAAIESTKLKLQNKEVELATLHSPEDNDISRKQITETKEIIADMEQRLVDLRGPPIDVKAALGVDPMGGILGAALGESSTETEARIEEAKKTATDLTGLVRKKDKRKAEGDAEGQEGEEEPSKKARTEEVTATS
ncbi:putative histone h1-binding protein [Diaporthe ampelina]|uniref:Putative histone h1-binding protein n=1 Tax=Diaporthe ampelina TaxID=1214573 RepID=A0A0G2FJR6_9PEZI|nr:putative histone h1-binding protein [Diaporthe ampelina]